MIAASVNKKQIKKTALIVLAVVILLAIIIYSAGLVLGEQQGGNNTIPGETTEQREAYLSSLGYELSNNSTVAQVEVPKEFDERFTAYNEMLKTIGFDLSEYKGETASKCTYLVTNFEVEQHEKISAILLVFEGNIIAGHILKEGETTEVLPLSTTPIATYNELQPDAQVSNILPDILQQSVESSAEQLSVEEQDYPTE